MVIVWLKYFKSDANFVKKKKKSLLNFSKKEKSSSGLLTVKFCFKVDFIDFDKYC